MPEKHIKLITATPISGDTSSDASWQWAMSRLQNCTKNHKACGFDKASSLPTRVLDLSILRKDIRLYETKNETGHYIALSHCWGDSRAIRTTLGTLAKHKEIIAWEALPRTFQDAIIIVRRLGLNYLWIDSLCIIQDDPADWSKESGRMADVYQNAYLTIAATKSSSDDGGCFSTASPGRLSRQLTVPGNISPSQIYARIEIPHAVFWSRDIPRPQRGQSEFPLFTRAWCYQEGMLSTRVLHFAADEVMWDCREKFDCECGYMASYLGTPKIDYTGGLKNPVYLPLQWRHIVEEYSGLELSCANDKLPALSGLVKQMQMSLNGRYLAGLWESNLFLDLLWQIHGENDRGRCVPWRAPTWSWVSNSNPICWQLKINCVGPARILARLVEANCDPAGSDVTGEVSSGQLTLSGRLVITHCLVSQGPYKNDLPRYVFDANSTNPPGYDPHPDIPLHERREAMVRPGLELYCLEIADISEHRFYLVLEKCTNEPGAYERVGLLDSRDKTFIVELRARSRLAVVKIV
jgi:hypothetical protein